MNKPCLQCGDVSSTSRCDACKPPDRRARDRPTRTNGARWKALSKRLRRQMPFCETCGAVERLGLDHIISLDEDPTLCYEVANLTVLCRDCNARKGSRPATTTERAQVHARIAARKSRRWGDDPVGQRLPTRGEAKRALYGAEGP